MFDPSDAPNIINTTLTSLYISELNLYRSWTISLSPLPTWLSIAIKRANIIMKWSPYMTLSTFLFTRMTGSDTSTNSHLLIQKLFTAFFNECNSNMNANEIFNWIQNKCELNNSLINIYERLELEYQATKDSYVFPIPKVKNFINTNWNINKTQQKYVEKSNKPDFTKQNNIIIPNPTTITTPPPPHDTKNNNNNKQKTYHNNKNNQNTNVATGNKPH